MGLPSIRISPLLMGVNAIMAFKIVVFPTPLTPMRQVISPLFAVKETPFRTCLKPNFFVMLLISIIQNSPHFLYNVLQLMLKFHLAEHEQLAQNQEISRPH